MTHPAFHPTTAAPAAGPGRGASQFDAFHAARARTDLVARLYAAAMGDDYPHEIGASSSCDWPLLGLMTARLRMAPGQLLVDAGCGAGGIGLWLARALAVRLVGFDLSPVAVAQAAGRSTAYGVADRAAFHVADLEATKLPDGCAHAVVCVDAYGCATNRDRALYEVGRALAPGGRLLITRAARRGAETSWRQGALAAGLTVEHVDERPGEPAMWERLYRLWTEHAEQLRDELGADQAQNMLHEADRMLPALSGRRAVLLTLRRPLTPPPPPGAADTMSGPDRHGVDGTVPSERTPQ